MRTVSFMGRVASVALAVAFCSASLAPRPHPAEQSAVAQSLRFGESLALSDFDGDNLIDRARLGAYGPTKSIEVYLSRTRQCSILQFETFTFEHGTLFARDVNDDGDVDLIWTDLLHPDDVVIWLNSGFGRFERICPHRYAARFVLSESGASGPGAPQRDPLVGPPRTVSPDLAIASRYITFSGTGDRGRIIHRALPALFSKLAPDGRGPPSLI